MSSLASNSLGLISLITSNFGRKKKEEFTGYTLLNPIRKEIDSKLPEIRARLEKVNKELEKLNKLKTEKQMLEAYLTTL